MATRGSNSAAFIAVLAISLITAVSGFVLGRALSDSDAQILSSAQEPVEALVPVEERSLAESVVISGVGTPGDAVTVVAQDRRDVSRLVVTRVFHDPGDVVPSGSPVVTLSGRPIFVLKMELTPYRNLHLGDTGDDVIALRDALEHIGHQIDDSDGFDQSVVEALEAVYLEHGFAAPSLDGSVFFDLTEFATYSEGDPVLVEAAEENSVVSEGDVLVTLRTRANTVVARADLVDAQAFSIGAEVAVQGNDRSVDGTVVGLSEFKDATADLLAGIDVEVAVGNGAVVDAGTPYTVAASSDVRSGATVPLSALRERAGEY